jgi:hypothetical protein
MKTEIKWSIPPSVTEALNTVPEDKPVALLLRHSVRPDLTPGEAGYSLPITEDGKRIRAIANGAGKTATPIKFKYLGDPGVFIVDEKAARINWREENLYSTADILTKLNISLPGMTYPYESSRSKINSLIPL